jgi:hypothetical protein
MVAVSTWESKNEKDYLHPLSVRFGVGFMVDWLFEQVR